MAVRIVGVRHHSPACARVVQHVLDDRQPSWVLLEGPSDLNGRLHELVALQHRLPIALYHFVSSEKGHSRSFTPFCETSPEWVAMQWAHDHGSELRFIDLPSWAKAFHHGENRTADRVERYAGVMKKLCTRLGIDGGDAVWDHLFEQPDPPAAILGRLDRYFEELRPDDADAPARDLERESFMASCVAWASEQGGDVVVVCGGFHKPALDRRWPDLQPLWPAEPELDGSARVGAYVVPWSYERLDSFAGYAAGMPSPGWYTELFEHGAHDGARRMLERAIARLRDVKHPVSAADRVAVEVQLAGLMSLRCHTSPTRTDVLDALCSALIKEALDVPPPWTERVGVRRGTDARLVAILETFRGHAQGEVDPRTPRPPLVEDVAHQLDSHGLCLVPDPGRTLDLDLFDSMDLGRSRVLHRLRVLQVPTVQRDSGPADPSAVDRREQWLLVEVAGTLPALLEASIWGGTLEDAALARLSHDMSTADGLEALLQALVSALFCGLERRFPELLQKVERAIQRERELASLGRAMQLLVDLWRHETVFIQANSAAVGRLITLVLRRSLWVYESLSGEGSDPGRQVGAIGLREVLRHADVDPADRSAAMSMLRRRSSDPSAPTDLRGASVGLRAALGEEVASEALAAVRGIPPSSLGDWLSGLFAVTRESLHREQGILAALNDRVGSLTPPQFIEALPALRLAFAWFPPRERESIAASILTLMNEDPSHAGSLVRQPVFQNAVLASAALEEDVERILNRYALLEDR